MLYYLGQSTQRRHEPQGNGRGRRILRICRREWAWGYKVSFCLFVYLFFHGWGSLMKFAEIPTSKECGGKNPFHPFWYLWAYLYYTLSHITWYLEILIKINQSQALIKVNRGLSLADPRGQGTMPQFIFQKNSILWKKGDIWEERWYALTEFWIHHWALWLVDLIFIKFFRYHVIWNKL